MKTLVNTIKEGIYSNLGVDSDLHANISQDWVKKYNLQRGNNMELIIGKNGKICSIYKQPVYQLGINDDSILEDGCLPSYLSFEAGDNITVTVGTTELKSFANLPEVERMNVMVSVSINCFNTITNCKYLGLHIFVESTPVITNVQPMICELIFNPTNIHRAVNQSDAKNAINTLNNIKGCKFASMSSNLSGQNLSINISYVSRFFKDVKALSNFFKNNSFNDKVTMYVNKISSLDFLDDAPVLGELYFKPSYRKVWIENPSDPMIKDFLAPISRNEKKLNTVYLFINCNSSEKIDIENYFNYIKKYSDIKFIVLR